MTDDQARMWAIVTGGSSGIGLEVARQLATDGFDVLIAAEDAGIHTAAADLGTAAAQVTPVQVDLATAEGVNQLHERIVAAGRPVDALVLNAGIGVAGPFIETSLEDDRRLIELNVMSTVHLAKLLLPAMVQRGAGRVLITASVASTMPGPWYATYAASKAFELSFAEAIRHELADTGVTVTALMPGPTDTNFFGRAGLTDTRVDQGPKHDAAEVAAAGVKAMMAGDDHVVVGLKNQAQVIGARAMPETMQASLHARMTEPGSGSRPSAEGRSGSSDG